MLILLIPMRMEAQRRTGLISKQNRSSLMRRQNNRNTNNGYLVLTLGPSYCFADPTSSEGLLGPIANQNFFLNQEATLGFRQTLSKNLGYKASFGYNHFSGSDIKNQIRNFSFETNSYNLSIVGEYTYPLAQRFKRRVPNIVYGYLGVGVMYSDADLIPKFGGNGTYEYKDKVFSPMIPFGIGYRYEFNADFSLGAEAIFKYSFSDFLDGFKPGASKSNEVLPGIQITLAYKLF